MIFLQAYITGRKISQNHPDPTRNHSQWIKTHKEQDKSSIPSFPTDWGACGWRCSVSHSQVFFVFVHAASEDGTVLHSWYSDVFSFTPWFIAVRFCFKQIARRKLYSQKVQKCLTSERGAWHRSSSWTFRWRVRELPWLLSVWCADCFARINNWKIGICFYISSR